MKKVWLVFIVGCFCSIIGEYFAERIGITPLMTEALVRKTNEKTTYLEKIISEEDTFDNDEKIVIEEAFSGIKGNLALIEKLIHNDIFRKPILITGLVGTVLFTLGFCIGRKTCKLS